MKSFDTALAAALALGASAGIAAAQGWDGFYVGGAFGASGNDFSATAPEGTFNGTNGAVFAGFNRGMGGLVLGAEVAATLGEVTTDNPNTYLRSLIDLKLRLGTTFGSALVYGLVGYSAGTSFAYGLDYSFNGVNYGVGLDYAVGDRLFVGAELLARNIDDGGSYLDTRPMTTASVRVGLRF